MNDKFLGTVDSVGELEYDIYFEFASKKVKARDKKGTDHLLFTTNSQNDGTIIRLAKEYLKSSVLL